MAGLRDRFAVMFATGLLASCGGDAREEAFALYDQPPPREWRGYAAEVQPALESAAQVWFADPGAKARPTGLMRLGGICGVAVTKWGRWIVRLDGEKMTAEHWDDVSTRGSSAQCEPFQTIGEHDLVARRTPKPTDLAKIDEPGPPAKWGYTSVASIMGDIRQRRQDAEEASYSGLTAMKASLRNPKTAEITERRFGPNGAICGYVNGENGFGGMTGPQRFVAQGPTFTLEEQVGTAAMNRIWLQNCP